MKTIQKQEFQCEICGHIYHYMETAKACERRPISQDKGVKVGDVVVITQGECSGKKATVEWVFVCDMEWGHYAWERYWHTVGISAKIIGEHGSRQLTFDGYEPA